MNVLPPMPKFSMPYNYKNFQLFDLKNIKLSQITAKTNNTKNPIFFPSEETRDELVASGIKDLSLVGFKCCTKNSTFKFILSNGMETDGHDYYTTYTTRMIPKDQKIKKVQIFHSNNVRGFKFFDEKKALIIMIG